MQGLTTLLSVPTAIGAFLAALLAFVITWIAAFVVRLLNAPVLFFYEEKERSEPVRLRELEATERRTQEMTLTRQESDPFVRAAKEKMAAAIFVGQKPKPFLEISIGETGAYFNTSSDGLYSINRTFNLKIENTHNQTVASSCKLYVTRIQPQSEYVGPWLLREGFSINAGDHVFIPLVVSS